MVGWGINRRAEIQKSIKCCNRTDSKEFLNQSQSIIFSVGFDPRFSNAGSADSNRLYRIIGSRI